MRYQNLLSKFMINGCNVASGEDRACRRLPKLKMVRKIGTQQQMSLQ
jgi:hypothetical protein